MGWKQQLQGQWKKHRDTISFNRNLIISDTISLFLCAMFAQILYYNLDENNVLDSIYTAIIEYCIDTPIFLILYFVDNRKRIRNSPRSYPIPCGRTDYKLNILGETKRLLGLFSVCDIMYVVIKIFIQFQILQGLHLEPFTASLISSLVGWIVFLVLINITLKATRIFSKDELVWYYSLILAISIANSIIFFSNISLRIYLDNIILVSAAIAAFVSAILVITKCRGLSIVINRFGSKYIFISITIGLGFWLTAEIVWTYYQIGLNVENPFPSIADAFWLTGYPFFGFALYKIFRNLLLTGRRATDRLTVREHYFVAGIVSIAASIIVISTYIYANIAFPAPQSDFDLNQKALYDFIVALAYPVLDAILLVPVITIIWSLRRIDPFHAHWILLCSFVILSTIGDIGFAYSEILYPHTTDEALWIWDTFFNASYICLAASLLWYRRFNLPLFEMIDGTKEVKTNHNGRV